MPLVVGGQTFAAGTFVGSGGADGNITVSVQADTKPFNAQIAGLVASAKKSFSGLISNIGNGLLLSLVALGSLLKLIIGLVVGIAAAFVGVIILLNRFGERLFSTFERGIDKTSAYFKLLEQLRTQFDLLRGAIFSIFATLLQAALPAIVTIVSWLTRMLDLFNQVLGALLGQKTVLKGIVNATQDQTKAEKAGALAAFDKLDVLKQQKDATADTSGVSFVQEQISDKAQSIADKIRGIFQSIKDIWQGFVKDWNDFWANSTLGKVLRELWQNFVTTWTQIWGVVQDTWNKIKLGWDEVVTGIKQILKGLLLGDWTLVFQGLVQVAKGVFDIIKAIIFGTFSGFSIYVAGVVNQVKIVVAALAPWFQEQWDKIKLAFGTFWFLMLTAANNNLNILKISMTSVFKSIVNTIIGFLNGMIQATVNGINSVVKAINTIQFTVPAWIPVIGGQSAGFNLATISAPKIPQLAQGAVIPPNAQFLAVLGDQKSGRNIEAPEGLIRQIIRDELGGQTQTVNVVAQVDGETLFKVQKRVALRHGTSLITAGNL